MNPQTLQTSQPTSAPISREDFTKAMLNILEDFSSEKVRLEEMQRAIVNILEDSAGEKDRLQQTQRAALNILEDFTEERGRLEETQRAILNILEDFGGEKTRLEDAQRAMLNLLDDFNTEREKTEAVNLQLRDTIDSLRRAKEAADAANRELEAFAYSVAHDLRSPVRHMDGFSKALMERYADGLDERGQQYLQYVRDGSVKMGQLIDDLLALTGVTQREMLLANVNLSKMALEIATELRNEPPERHLEFVIAPGLMAKGDPGMLHIVLDNLLDNARKFTSKRERAIIEFGVTQQDGKQAYYVRDNGVGFNMAFADKLFRAFERLHSADEFPGTGVGLATVERIIRRHGGRVWAEGEVNEGSTFYFTLS